MKSSILSLLICLLFTVSSIGQEIDDKSLLGEWTFEFDKSFSQIDSKNQHYLDSISIDKLKVIESNYRNRRIIFNENGNYLQIQGNGFEVKGSWVFYPENQLLEISLPGGAVFYQYVTLLDDSSILIEPKTDGNLSMVINKWYFTKS
jgi:hypothetical protein